MDMYSELIAALDGCTDYDEKFPADIKTRVDELRTILANSKNALYFIQKSVYSAMLTNNLPDPELNRTLCENYDLYPFNEGFFMIALRCGAIDPAIEEQRRYGSPKVFVDVLDDISATAERALATVSKCVSVVLNSDVICIMNNIGLDPSLLDSLVDNISDLVLEKHSISLIRAISDPASGLNMFSVTYASVMKLLDYGMVRNTSGVLRLCHDMRHPTENFESDALCASEHSLRVLVGSGLFVEAADCLRELISYCSNVEISCIQQYKCRLYGWSDLILTATDSWANAAQANHLRGAEYDRVFDYGNVAELQRNLLGYLDFVAHIYKSFSSADGLAGRIREYINRNLCTYELSVNMVAEHFLVSVAVVSNSFKQQYGLGILDFIHLSRLKLAKDALLTTQKTVLVIAQELGYGSSLALNRVFKRYEGITPSEFRRDALS